jgi:hypothetical protein
MEPGQIIELDPESAPRTSAIILILCGVLGVAFFVINIAFTGDDPYQRMTYDDGQHPAWDGEDQYPMQEGYHIMPNLWRGKTVDPDEAPEEEVDLLQKAKAAAAAKRNKPTTGPTTPANPGQPTPPATGTPSSPGMTTPAKPATPGGLPGKSSTATPGK